MPPLVLYKFLDTKTAEKVLRDFTVRYTPLPELNDPAESPAFRDGRDMHRTARRLLIATGLQGAALGNARKLYCSTISLQQTEKSGQKWGMLCLSEGGALKYSPMWSHYAESHKGVAIGLSTASKALDGFSGPHLVDYSGRAVAVADTASAFLRKQPCWREEREYRAWKLLEPGYDPTDLAPQLAHFAAADVLDIVLGARCERWLWELVYETVHQKGLDTGIRRCVLNVGGRLGVVPEDQAVAKSFYDNDKALLDAYAAEDDSLWREMWSRAGHLRVSRL